MELDSIFNIVKWIIISFFRLLALDVLIVAAIELIKIIYERRTNKKEKNL